jgi:protease-4
MRKSHATRLTIMLMAVTVCNLLAAGCITINLLPQPGPLKEDRLSGSGDAKVLLMELSGTISNLDEEGLVGRPNQVAHLKEELTKAGEDPAVKAIVLRINSPGGTVTASDILYHEIRAFKERKKIPVVASIMDVGASGGYYVAMAADTIVAHPSSVTGSLGVIMLTLNAQGLLEKIGLEAKAVVSGPRKDMGSPFRAMTEEERAIFQGLIDSFYQRFLGVIKSGRPNLSAETIRKLADGRVYSGDQAKDLGLIDGIGYLDEAITLAKQGAGLGEARVVRYRRAGEYRPNIYASLLSNPLGLAPWNQMDLLGMVRGGTPQFMYLWMP